MASRDTEALSPLARAWLIAGFAVLVCLRLPNVVLHGRLWGEEGPAFYLRAATLPPLDALFAPFGGYLNLVANGAPILARHLVPLEFVPWVTSGVGLLFQCVPAILLVCSNDAWLRRPGILVACLLLIATAPATEEVWLQTLHSQFHLALCCALILALDVPRGVMLWFGFALLFLAPLCGPSGAALAPLFLLRAAIDRSGARLLQGCILGLGAALQLGLFYAQTTGRSYGIAATTVLSVIYVKHIAVPFLGRVPAELISESLKQRIAAGLVTRRAVAASLAFIAVYAIMLARRRSAPAVWLAAAASVMLCLAVYGSLSTAAGLLTIGEAGRYSFVPQVLTGLALAAVASGVATPWRWEVWVARGAVVWLIVVGTADISRTGLFMGNGPRWREQVALWRQDHGHPIAIWPEGWSMSLPHE